MGEGAFGSPEIVEREMAILNVGGGMAARGAAFAAARRADDDTKITLVGITRDDLVGDVGRQADYSVHMVKECGLPIWENRLKGGNRQFRERGDQV